MLSLSIFMRADCGIKGMLFFQAVIGHESARDCQECLFRSRSRSALWSERVRFWALTILASAGDTSESFGSPARAQSRSNKLLLDLAILCSVIGLTPEWNLAAGFIGTPFSAVGAWI